MCRINLQKFFSCDSKHVRFGMSVALPGKWIGQLRNVFSDARYESLIDVSYPWHVCACLIRQDWTAAQFHTVGRTSPQCVLILHLFSTWLGKFCNALPFETFFTLYTLPKSQRHLCVGFLIHCFILKKKAYCYSYYMYLTNLQLYQHHLWLNFFTNFNLSNTTKLILFVYGK